MHRKFVLVAALGREICIGIGGRLTSHLYICGYCLNIVHINVLSTQNWNTLITFYIVLGNDFTNILKHSIERRRVCTLVGNCCPWWQQVWWEWVVFQDDVESDQRLALIKSSSFTYRTLIKPSLFTYRNTFDILIRDVQVRINLPVLTFSSLPIYIPDTLAVYIPVGLYVLFCLALLETHFPNTCLFAAFCTWSITVQYLCYLFL